jgi:probable O-glycosylation ligase (exosortase A-associated)
MRDLAMLLALLGMAGVAFRLPWVGVLALAFVGYMHPQGFGSGWGPQFPAYQLMFILVVLGTLVWTVRTRPELTIPWSWQILLLVLLAVWFLVTTLDARVSLLAWPKFFEVLKLLPPLLLTLVLIDTRRKLYALVVAMALAISIVAFKGGYWAFMTGFQDRVYGPPGSQYHGNNEFAVAMAMTIPLLVLWLRETGSPRLRIVIIVLVALSYAAVLSSWSRGGILALASMTVMLLLHSRRRLVGIAAVVGLLVLVPLLFSQKWLDRMATLADWQEEATALSRLRVWRTGMEYVGQEPFTGGGFEGWRVITYFRGGKIDWHSGYVEMAVEHGLVGLGLWATLYLGTVVSLARLSIWARRARQPWVASYAAMIQASLVAYAAGAVTLGIAYWALPLHLVALSVVLKRLAAARGYPGIRELPLPTGALAFGRRPSAVRG